MAAGDPQSRPPLAALAAVFGVTFALAIAAIGARATTAARVTADEPQYLLTALSIAEDFNLDIADEIAEGRYRPFHEAQLDPQTEALSGTPQRLSPHDPLLPLLLAVPMGLGGWVGAKVALALIAATTAAATLLLAVGRFGASSTPAAIVVGAAFAAPPLTSYATQVYPEMPAALLVIIAVLALTGSRSTRASLVVVLVVIALPWLAIKYVPIAAVLAVALVASKWSVDRRAVAVPAALLAVAGLVYLLVHQRVYGGWTVYAAGDHFVGSEFDVVGSDPNYVGRSRRLIGLLVDREFGLVPWAGGYLLAVAALLGLARRRANGWILVTSIIAVGWAMATWVALTMHGWWWPGRQVVVLLPLIVAAIAWFAEGRAVARVVAVAGFLLGSFSWLWLVVEASTGRRTLIVDFSATTNPWYRLWSQLFPNHMNPGAVDLVVTIAWALVFALHGMWAWRSSPPQRPSGASDE